ncbi:hypothetical protein SLEP1_g56753 [Rubroshorea leprosula]|uniref:Uncharacterized protein n=1 Tax=Rubroshorea leprosula TaxID=152421 RepID=A0AAV5MKQ8_9ROSI|nr:hypothetical protein SLEP1_g56753 [Rubroshorea leprosula]
MNDPGRINAMMVQQLKAASRYVQILRINIKRDIWILF